MLRYKNSLLERILLEKGTVTHCLALETMVNRAIVGVDVQAELKMKTEGSHMLPHHTTPGHQPSPVQRAVLNRQGQPRRSASSSTTKPIRPHAGTSHPPPRLQPTPPAQTLSPVSSNSPHPAGKSIPRSMSGDVKTQVHRQHPVDPRQQKFPNNPKMGVPNMQNHAVPGAAGNSNNFYQSPYLSHAEQLGMLPHGNFCFIVLWKSYLLIKFQNKNTMRMLTCSRMRIRAKAPWGPALMLSNTNSRR